MKITVARNEVGGWDVVEHGVALGNVETKEQAIAAAELRVSELEQEGQRDVEIVVDEESVRPLDDTRQGMWRPLVVLLAMLVVVILIIVVFAVLS